MMTRGKIPIKGYASGSLQSRKHKRIVKVRDRRKERYDALRSLQQSR